MSSIKLQQNGDTTFISHKYDVDTTKNYKTFRSYIFTPKA